MHHQFISKNSTYIHQIVSKRTKQFKRIICKMIYWCFISVQMPYSFHTMIKHANVSHNTGESTEKFTGYAKGSMCVRGGGEVVGNSSMNHHWGSLGGEREQKRKKKEQTIPSKKNALLLKTEPDIETAAVDSLDRWCQ